MIEHTSLIHCCVFNLSLVYLKVVLKKLPITTNSACKNVHEIQALMQIHTRCIGTIGRGTVLAMSGD